MEVFSLLLVLIFGCLFHKISLLVLILLCSCLRGFTVIHACKVSCFFDAPVSIREVARCNFASVSLYIIVRLFSCFVVNPFAWCFGSTIVLNYL